MTSHVGLMALFALFTSVVFATLMRDRPGDQARFGLRVFTGFIVAAVLLGWLLYPLPL